MNNNYAPATHTVWDLFNDEYEEVPGYGISYDTYLDNFDFKEDRLPTSCRETYNKPDGTCYVYVYGTYGDIPEDVFLKLDALCTGLRPIIRKSEHEGNFAFQYWLEPYIVEVVHCQAHVKPGTCCYHELFDFVKSEHLAYFKAEGDEWLEQFSYGQPLFELDPDWHNILASVADKARKVLTLRC